MVLWTRKPQEQNGSYFFTGNFYVTRGVVTELSSEEITTIYLDVREYVHQNNGVDYLFVYTDTEGRKLFFIDNLNREMIESGQYRP
ncbi:MAG: hypothetical protein K8F30_00745, partial [Taibaiella sp.]|nr:hypothetical protein [Taibaiella sp.]